ncbi:hypothetical protein AgCh_017674 [Apium graveolens]
MVYTKTSIEQSKLWHKKLSHLNFKAINTLVKKELVRDMPTLKFAQDEVCEASQKGKIKRSSHKSLECLDENETEALKFENLNIDIDSEDEAEINTSNIINEESTEQVNHEDENPSYTPEFDCTNSGGEK